MGDKKQTDDNQRIDLAEAVSIRRPVSPNTGHSARYLVLARKLKQDVNNVCNKM